MSNFLKSFQKCKFFQIIAHLQRWAAHHWHILQKPFGFKNRKPPNATTFSRILAKIPLGELQEAFTHFLNTLISDQCTPLIVVADGKTSKQILDKDGDVLSRIVGGTMTSIIGSVLVWRRYGNVC